MKNRSKYLISFNANPGAFTAVVVSLLFLLASVLLIEKGGELLWVIPPVLLVTLLAFIAIDRFLMLLLFLVPLSVQLIFIIPDSPVDIFLPTELMLAIILVLMAFKLLSGKEINRKLLLHPVSIVTFCLLTWSFITSLSGTMPIVSLKSFITKLWFIAGFYILASELFSKPERITKYFIAYIAGMVPVIIYYLMRMKEAGIFNQKAAYQAIRPFFNDHTSFGAALAFCIPVIYLLVRRESSKIYRTGLFILLLVFTAALVFSYSRAAWLSIGVAALVTLALALRISGRTIILMIAGGAIIVMVSWSDLISMVQKNRQDSSDNLKNHLQSIANIRSDASNLERVNRWNAAMRMFKERPLLGWGPATYQFQYAPFQKADEKTIISTNYGEGGNAHSEYLGSLVDSGIPGLLFYLLLLIMSIRKGIILWTTHPDRQTRNIALALVAGLVTYTVHGALNNFLDTDKISALFWGMIAAIVAIDNRQKEDRVEENGTIKKEELSQVGGDN
jgi:putative inorganic carbon (hco3(-)) transporter